MARETENLELDPQVLESGVRAVLEGKQPGGYRVLEMDEVPASLDGERETRRAAA